MALIPLSLIPPIVSRPSSGFTNSGVFFAFTAITADLRNPDSSLGILCIPRLGVNAKIFEGTDSATLGKGVGHFIGASLPAVSV